MSARRLNKNPQSVTRNTKLKTVSSLLLEIGTEEIPARFLPGAISELRNTATKIFDEYRIEYDYIDVFASPRRLAFIMSGISSVQNDNVREVFGPSKKAAFDDRGNPTKAAIGFANSQGIKISDLIIKQKGKGEYIVAAIEEKGAGTKLILPEILKKIILSIHFPKSMRWGNSRISFVRPIQWILAMFGTETVNFELDGIKSSNTTKGHRFLSHGAIQINEISSYTKLLENNFVIIDHEKRENIIRKGIESLFDNSKMQPIMDKNLIDTVNFLVEFPVPVACSFSSDYLKLPKELLITVMKDHQKYFAVQDINGNLTNNFVVISNTGAENSGTIRIGAERVIKARFDDAKFYFQEDLKKPLSDRVEKLKHVTFHDEIGTLFDKTERLVSISTFLSEMLNPSIKDKLERAAFLSKSDLVTGVVREFPELQGVIGKYYALRDGEESEVADAIEEQYLPKFFGGMLPQTDVGALLSLSDKIDNVASFFCIGLIPTGSEDPFALRRQSMGIVSTILDRAYSITIREIFDVALQNLSNISKIKFDTGSLENIINFMEQRLEFIFSSLGYTQELISSVLSLSSIHPLRTIIDRMDALKKFKGEAIFPDFLLAMKRVNNILPDTPLPLIRGDLLLQEEEKNLYSHITKLRIAITPCIKEGRFYDSLKIFSEITTPINNFFDKVLVMDKQEEIKSNRLALLKEVWLTASLIADFSKLI